MAHFADADAFLDSLLLETEGPAASSSGAATSSAVPDTGGYRAPASLPATTVPREAIPAAAEPSLEVDDDFERLEQTLNDLEIQDDQRVVQELTRIENEAHAEPMQFRLDDDDEDVVDAEASARQDALRDEVPSPPADFTDEDLALREALVDFYRSRNRSNLASVDGIVRRYRGGGVADLWASLGVKYELSPVHVVDLLAKTLYSTTPLECSKAEQSGELERAISNLQADAALGSGDLLQSALAHGSVDVLRALLCRKGSEEMRPMLWKILLGYLPLARHTEFNALQGEKRAVYMRHRQELLEFSDQGVQVNLHSVSSENENEVEDELEMRRNLVETLRNEVETIGGDVELFQRPSTCNSLVALLFVYAQLNPGIRYVQGMNDIAAVILYALAPGSDIQEAEADAFWCFTGLMLEIQERFIQSVDETNGGVHKIVGTSGSLLSKYDPDLARHLCSCELEPGIFALRWFSLLFARDMALPDVVRLWDALISDPKRYELCGHLCAVLVMSCREELLSTANVMVIAEALQAAPSKGTLGDNLRKAWAVCALERRTQTPPFPPLSAADVVQEVAGAFFSGLFKKF